MPPSNMLTSWELDGVRVPRFLYGTAWKEEQTGPLVEQALAAGFRGIDTANQRKHYHEAGVGEAVAAAIQQGLLARGDLFLQTKFTFRGGQDHRLPYDPAAPIADQVRQSCERSLVHLQTDVIDSFVLHGPMQRAGLTNADWEAWGGMEQLRSEGRVRLLGVSNVGLDQLRELCRGAQVKPRFVQNRCFATEGWDREVRRFCDDAGMVYQGFSLLTANRGVLADPTVRQIATRHGRTVPQVIFRLALELGMLPLTGTTDPEHLREDLGSFDFALSPAEVTQLEAIAG